jgi:hypothetical protein
MLEDNCELASFGNFCAQYIHEGGEPRGLAYLYHCGGVAGVGMPSLKR